MSTPPTASLPGLVPQSLRVPEIEPTARLLFIINAASGRNDSDTTRRVIEGRCLIERWDCAATARAFVPMTVTEVNPGRGQGVADER